MVVEHNMGVVVFAKVQGLVKSESPRTQRVHVICDFESPRTFLKTTALIYIFCGSNTPDKNLKSIDDIICPFASHLTGI